MADDPTTQDPAPEPPQADPVQDPAPEPGAKPEPDWKAQARKWEERAKANAGAAKKLADIEAASMTAQEQAEARAAAAEAKAAAAVESIATAKLEAALTGLVPDPVDVVGDLNVKKFLGEDGQVDPEKVAALRARYQALAPQGPRAPAVNPAQGNGQPAKSMAEIIADAEKTGNTKQSLRLKSQQLVQLRKQG
jgi:hypothetical protein